MKLFVVIAAVAAALSASPVWAKGAMEGSMREPKIRERSAATEKAERAKADKAARDCGACLKEAGIRAAGTALVAGAASVATGVGAPATAVAATAAGATALWVEARNCAAACDRTMQREAVRSEKPAPVERTVNENPKFGRSF